MTRVRLDELADALKVRRPAPERRVFIALSVNQARAILRLLERNGIVTP